MSSAPPAPPAKNAGDALPMRIEIFPGEGRDRIRSRSPPAGRIVAAEFLRGVPPGAPPGTPPVVQRSLVTLNLVAPGRRCASPSGAA
jgi:hypothetical protein